MSNWLKIKLRAWLGVSALESRCMSLDGRINRQGIAISELERLTKDLVSIGVDVHFKEPHMILIYSRLNGGQIREVPARFEDLRELNIFVREMADRFKTRSVTWDGGPAGPMIREMLRRDEERGK